MGEVASFLGLGERRFLPYGPEERGFRPQGLRERSFLSKKLRSWSCIFLTYAKQQAIKILQRKPTAVWDKQQVVHNIPILEKKRT